MIFNTFMENKYWKTKMYQMILLLLLIGSLNWGTTALGYNFVEIIKNLLNNSLKMETYIDKIIYFLVALAGITLAMNRDLWSPCIENFSALRPTAPVLNIPSLGNGLVNLSWSASANATSYKIKVHDILANRYLYADTNNLSHTFTGLTNGRSYNFSVVGKNSRGESPPSNTRGPIIPYAAPPPPPPPPPPPTSSSLPTLNIREIYDILYLDIKFYSSTAEIIIDSSNFGIYNGQTVSWGSKVINYNDVRIENGEGSLRIVGSTDRTRNVVFKLVDGINTITNSIKMQGGKVLNI